MVSLLFVPGVKTSPSIHSWDLLFCLLNPDSNNTQKKLSFEENLSLEWEHFLPCILKPSYKQETETFD